MTDIARWRLLVEDGRQTWHYIENKDILSWKQTSADKYWLGIYSPPPLSPPTTAYESAENGFKFLKELQTEDGHWAGEYGGPMFLIPGLVISMYITKSSFPPGYVPEIIRYLKTRAHKADGGWGIHIESASTVFGTALNYVALRLLGVSSDDPACVKARNCLHRLGDARGVPAWGKFWLAVLNVYSWDGVSPIPPELWLLPYISPIHPGRMWCHTRLVYLPMSYFYAKKFQAVETELILDLRKELYIVPFEDIKWKDQQNFVNPVDLFAPHSKTLDFLNGVYGIYEKFPNSYIRSIAIKEVLFQIRAEDKNTKYLDIGPVNKAMNMLVAWVEDGPNSESFKKHLERIPDFMWLGKDGMMMNGTNGSQLWDTAFITQALIESGIAEKEFAQPYMRNVLNFMDNCQIKHNMENHKRCYRHISKGAWPFSTRDQSYTVSDCTAEGLKSVLLLQNDLEYISEQIKPERLYDAIDVLLSMQNADGGFASYEETRGPKWLEYLNPAEVFGNIMIEYSYPECTTAALLGFTTFKKYFPEYKLDQINNAIAKCVDYIRNSQRDDGSWFGSWAICFTYAMMFAMESLASVNEVYMNSQRIQKACEFLISKQREDGGWGESYKACETGEWVEHEESQVVQTSWALLALMAVKYPNKEPIERGIKLIMDRQQPNGEWLQEGIEGVFNRNCMISYPNYKLTFTIWALGRYSRIYEIKDVGMDEINNKNL